MAAPSPEPRMQGSMSQGTILTLPWPWPPQSNQVLLNAALSDGSATLSIDTKGLLHLLLDGDGGTSEFVSCPLLVTAANTATNIGVSWRLPESMNMIVGQTIVGSLGHPEMAPAEASVVGGIPKDQKDFSRENAAALERRRGKLSGSQRLPKRRPAGKDEIFESVRAELVQITDLLALVQQGRLDHARGLAARLRLLIADGDPMPLLQLCAAMRDEPLIVYVPPIVKAKREPHPVFGVRVESVVLDVSSSPTALFKNPVDLDVWLDSRAAQISEEVINQRDLIKQIANTIGAHLDRDVRPSVDMLRTQTSNLGGSERDFLIAYLCNLARMTADLISRILERDRS